MKPIVYLESRLVRLAMQFAVGAFVAFLDCEDADSR